jgi:hypothetical protein
MVLLSGSYRLVVVQEPHLYKIPFAANSISIHVYSHSIVSFSDRHPLRIRCGPLLSNRNVMRSSRFIRLPRYVMATHFFIGFHSRASCWSVRLSEGLDAEQFMSTGFQTVLFERIQMCEAICLP